jgi:predicted RNA-binding Zn-ribbon protein involved in translation (DUF1610 family)
MANFEMFPPIVTNFGVFSGGPFGLKLYEAQKKILQELTESFLLPAHLCGSGDPVPMHIRCDACQDHGRPYHGGCPVCGRDYDLGGLP